MSLKKDHDTPSYFDMSFNEKADEAEFQTITKKYSDSCTNGEVSGDGEFIIIDEAEDPVSKNSTPLLRPIMIKLYRHQPQVVYPLKFVQGFCCTCNEKEDELVIKDDIERLKRKITNSAKAVDNKKRIPQHLKSLSCAKVHRKKTYPPNYFFEHDKLIINGSNFPQCPRISIENQKAPIIRTQHLHKWHSMEHVETITEIPQKEDTSVKLSKNQDDDKNDDDYYNYYYEEAQNTDITPKPKNMAKTSKEDKGIEYTDYKASHRRERDKRNERVWKEKMKKTFRRTVDEKRLQKVIESRRKRWKDSGKKTRQSCDSEKDQLTIHCLKYNDLWYSVYSFNDPMIIQDIDVQLFQKHSHNGDKHWVDLTRGSIIKMGTSYSQATDNFNTLAISYSTSIDQKNLCSHPDLCPIDHEDKLMLVPSHMDDSSEMEHPEAEGGPGEYIIVSRSDVSYDGWECDKIGISSKGFAAQEKPCDLQSGACLKNQPIDLWTEDMERRMEGEPGKYFVENFGFPPSALTPSASKYKGDYLILEATGQFDSLIEIELRSDMNAFIRQGFNVQIQSIITDSSLPKKTSVEILIVNTGITSGQFSPKLSECTGDLPQDCFPEGPKVTIVPLQRHVFRIFLDGLLPLASMTCTVEIENEQMLRVASRELLIRKRSRCLCAFHCACSCLTGESDLLECTHLMKEEYLAAGYFGEPSNRVLIHAELPIHLDYFDIFLLVFAFLLLLGKLKMLLGIRWKNIRLYGMPYLRGSARCCLGLEPSRGVDLYWITECILNTLFFVLYPAKILYVWIVKCLPGVYCAGDSVNVKSMNINPGRTTGCYSKEIRPQPKMCCPSSPRVAYRMDCLSDDGQEDF